MSDWKNDPKVRAAWDAVVEAFAHGKGNTRTRLDALCEAVASAAPSSSATPPLNFKGNRDELIANLERSVESAMGDDPEDAERRGNLVDELVGDFDAFLTGSLVTQGPIGDVLRSPRAASSPSAEGTEPPMTGCVNDQFFAARAVFKSHGVTVNPSVLTEALDAAIRTFPLYRRSPVPAGTPAQEEK